MSDVRDILDLEVGPLPEITKESFLNNNKKRYFEKPVKTSKRPEGMAREVFALLYTDNKDAPPLVPSDTGIGSGYKQNKAKLGMKNVRKWRWLPFVNTARTDGVVFHHWRRITDDDGDYPFAKFNKKLDIPTYTVNEYNAHLRSNPSKWTKAQTDHLFDLANRFDLRFIVMADRWDKDNYGSKSVEDLKERYYEVVAILTKLRGSDKKIYYYDADHERRRKEQLKKLFDRSAKEVEEEQMLLNELKKIEARKKERERKTQDLQKLISQADQQIETPTASSNAGASAGSSANATPTTTRKYEKKLYKKKNIQNTPKPSKVDSVVNNLESAGIKFADLRGSGVSLRSQKMKLPTNIGQKKAKALEAALVEFKLDPAPPPTEDICNAFNELRSDIVLLCELRTALQACKFELESLKHQYEAESPATSASISAVLEELSDETQSQDNIIDVVGASIK